MSDPQKSAAACWSAIAERDFDAAVVLSDHILAGASEAHRAWWLYFRGALHRQRGELASSKQWLLRASEALARGDGRQASPELCFKLATHLNISGLTDEALAVLSLTPVTDGDADQGAHVLRRRLEEALRLARRVATANCSVVPIGQECLPYDLLCRWGLGLKVVEGPFTAGVFFGDGPTKAVEDDFLGFSDPRLLRKSKLPSGLEAPSIPSYGALLNHEAGAHWIQSDYERLSGLYTARSANFRAAMTEPHVLFVLDRRYPIDLGQLVRALETAREGRSVRLLVIRPDQGPEISERSDPRVTEVRADRPGEGYVWYDPESYNTPRGYRYERRIAKAVAMAVCQEAGEP